MKQNNYHYNINLSLNHHFEQSEQQKDNFKQCSTQLSMYSVTKLCYAPFSWLGLAVSLKKFKRGSTLTINFKCRQSHSPWSNSCFAQPSLPLPLPLGITLGASIKTKTVNLMYTALSEYLDLPFLFFTMEVGGLTGDKICYSCVPKRRCQLLSLKSTPHRKKWNCHFRPLTWHLQFQDHITSSQHPDFLILRAVAGNIATNFTSVIYILCECSFVKFFDLYCDIFPIELCAVNFRISKRSSIFKDWPLHIQILRKVTGQRIHLYHFPRMRLRRSK